MLDHTQAPAAFQPRLVSRLALRNSHDETAATEELLPFTVRLVSDEEALDKAVQIRHQAYARHLPEFAETLRTAESADGDNGVVVLLAQSKVDDSPLGTMRIQTNQFKPLCLEQSVVLPEWLRNRRLAEATRLGVTNEKVGRLVKTVLFKAYFQYCLQTGIEWMVIAGRSPIDRQYERLMFDDVFPGMGFIPLLHASNLPHRVMSFNIDTAEQRWAQANHPLLGFMCDTRHPDIQLGDTRRWAVAPAAMMHTFAAHGANLPM